MILSGTIPTFFRVLLFCLPAALPVAAQYRFDHWTTEQGLPQNSVPAITQTRDGYLWMTTYNGLVRFDGVRFTVFDRSNSPGLNSNSCNILFEDAAGALWIGLLDNGIVRYHDGVFTTYTTQQGLPGRAVREIQNSATGEVLVTTGLGSAWWRNGRFEMEPGSENEIKVHLGRSGTRWALDEKGLHSRRGDQISHYNLPVQPGRLNSLLYEDRRGHLWLALRGKGLFKVQDGKLIDYTKRLKAIGDQGIKSILEDKDGAFWFGTENAGLIHFRDEPQSIPTQYTTADGLPANIINALYRDREGVLWIGTGGGGVSRLSGQFISAYSTQQGLAGDIVHAVLADRANNLWVATHAGLSKITNGVARNYSAADGLPLIGLQSLHEDSNGKLWIGSYTGLCSFKDGVFADSIPNINVWSILEDRQGNRWVGTHFGLLKFKDGIKTEYSTKDGLPSNTIRAIFEDRQGNLWFGTEGGLVKYANGRFTVFTTKDGLTGNRVWTIYEDAEGLLWLGTIDGGLSRFRDGKFTNYTTAQGLANNSVFQILEDDRGNFWMSCYRGLFSVSRRQLNDFAAGKLSTINSVSYGKADGMLNSDCNGGRQPSGVKTADGRLWFTTLGGVAEVNPSGLTSNPLPPPVLIEEAKIDNALTNFGAEVRLLPGQANLEIRYTALSFIKPEQIRFRYKLVGQDRNWIEAGTRRLANYSYLQPGTYNFQVIAANSDGVWNELGASLRVVVVPPFYRTWWFSALMAGGLATIVGLGFRLRLTRLRKEHTAKEAFSRQLLESQESFSRRLIESQEAERKRIAAELHDSLGQSLLVIKNRAYLGTLQPEDAQGAQEQLNEISEATADAIHQVREIAYYLRPSQLDRLGLTTSLEEMLDQVGGSSGILFEVDLASLDGVFAPEDEINFYRIVQECLNNIVKHSRATVAEVSIRNEAGFVNLLIRDNGQGFSLPAATQNAHNPRSGGFGLTGIAERVRMLGGQHNIDSAPGQGTTVKVQIPIKGTHNAEQ